MATRRRCRRIAAAPISAELAARRPPRRLPFIRHTGYGPPRVTAKTQGSDVGGMGRLHRREARHGWQCARRRPVKARKGPSPRVSAPIAAAQALLKDWRRLPTPPPYLHPPPPPPSLSRHHPPPPPPAPPSPNCLPLHAPTHTRSVCACAHARVRACAHFLGARARPLSLSLPLAQNCIHVRHIRVTGRHRYLHLCNIHIHIHIRIHIYPSIHPSI